MNEIKSFIQNSDKKNTTYCSLQMKNQLTTDRRNRDSSIKRKSQLMVQVHNGSLQDVFSPQRKSSDSKPMNIVINGSCSRFGHNIGTSAREIEEI